jgi:predicted secreted protein
MSPIFEDFGTIDSTAIFHRGDVHNVEIDEKEKTITWFFRVGAEVEVNGKKWIVDDDRAQITKKYFNDEDFQAMRVALQEFDKMAEAEFRIHNSKYLFFFEKGERGYKKRND